MKLRKKYTERMPINSVTEIINAFWSISKKYNTKILNHVKKIWEE